MLIPHFTIWLHLKPELVFRPPEMQNRLFSYNLSLAHIEDLQKRRQFSIPYDAQYSYEKRENFIRSTTTEMQMIISREHSYTVGKCYKIIELWIFLWLNIANQSVFYQAEQPQIAKHSLFCRSRRLSHLCGSSLFAYFFSRFWNSEGWKFIFPRAGAELHTIRRGLSFHLFNVWNCCLLMFHFSYYPALFNWRRNLSRSGANWISLEFFPNERFHSWLVNRRAPNSVRESCHHQRQDGRDCTRRAKSLLDEKAGKVDGRADRGCLARKMLTLIDDWPLN